MSLTANKTTRLQNSERFPEDLALSGLRLITQFEMMTSMLSSGTGRCSISPSLNSTFSKPELVTVPARFFEHGRGHVDPDDLALRANLLRSVETIDAATAP